MGFFNKAYMFPVFRMLLPSQVWFSDQRFLASAVRVAVNDLALCQEKRPGATHETLLWWDERVSCNPSFFITQNGKKEYYGAVAASIKDATRSAKFTDWLFVRLQS